MSYNQYPNPNPINYSPYFQQPASQDGRSQYSDQSRNANGYQTNSYQPLSAYQTQHPQSSAPQSTNPSSTYSAQGYGQPQASRAGYQDNRAPVDTSALGNLAYASSLGRDNSNLQQIMSYNRAQNPPEYGSTYGMSSTQPAQNATSHDPIQSSSAAHNSRAQAATSSPSFGYSSNTPNARYAGQASSIGGSGQVHTQFPAPQQQRSSPQQHQMNQYNKQPSRPASGQALHHPHSRTGSQGVQSPTVRTTNQAASSNLANQYTTSNQKESAGVSNAQEPMQNGPSDYQASAASRSGNYTPNTTSRNTAPNPQRTANSPVGSQVDKAPKNYPYNPPISSTNSSHSNTGTNQNIGPITQNTPTTSHSLTTVNPSQVFNDVEYRRRQAEAEAARKKAEDARNEAQRKENAPINVPSVNQSEVNTGAESEKKKQMELEMKTMIEKMREYKSKDPGLFSEIWEGVKKGQPQPQPPQRASPQTIPQGSIASPVVNGQLPPESELPAAESSTDTGKGRVSAQKRKRGGSSLTPKKPATPKKGSNKNPIDAGSGSQKIPAANQSQRPIPPSMPPAVAATAQMTQPSASIPKPPTFTPSAANAPASAPAQPRASGGTYWPENNKRQLAEAARMALTSAPPNAGKSITTNEIHQLLDQNPSYIQMCEILEYRGFIIDRGQFARTLLSAVPDLASATSKTPPTRPMPNEVPGPSPSQIAPPRPTPPPEQQHNGAVKGKLVPMGPPLEAHNGQSILHPPVSASPAVALRTTKQDMARKRTFSEIVDLTQDIDEDDEPPRQRLREDNGDDPPGSLSAEKPVDKADNLVVGVDNPGVDNPGEDNPSAEATLPPVTQDGESLDEFRHNPTTGAGGKYLHSLDIILPINKRQDAFRRSSYDRKTIARDFLLAVGKHPTMAPLNAHLGNLRNQFITVDYDSNLSTFRWDLIDPGGPLPPPPSPPPEQTTSDIDNEDRQVAISGINQHHRKGLKPTRGGHTSGTPRPGPLQSNGTPIPSFDRFRLQPNPQATPNSSGKRRAGRPPGAKNKSTRSDKGVSKTPTKQARDSQRQGGSFTERQIPSQPPNVLIPSRPRMDSTPAKPSGLKNTMTPIDGIAVVIPSRSPSVAISRASADLSMRKGRPSIDDSPTPSYKVYKCQWHKCPAELHSVEKLKKHVRKHRNVESFMHGSLPCLWAKCKCEGLMSEVDWDKHVEGVHIDVLDGRS